VSFPKDMLHLAGMSSSRPSRRTVCHCRSKRVGVDAAAACMCTLPLAGPLAPLGWWGEVVGWWWAGGDKVVVVLALCIHKLRQSTSVLMGDPDPYPWVFQIQNALPGSMRVSATRWLRAASQKLVGSRVLVGPQVLGSTYKYSGY
jgi:hypothetical protein